MAIKVNGHLVPDEVVTRELTRLQQRQQQEPGAPPAEDLVREAESTVIDRTLLQEEAVRRFPTLPEDEIHQAIQEMKKRHPQLLAGRNAAQQREVNQLMRDRAEFQVRGERLFAWIYRDLPEIADDELLRHYNARLDLFVMGESVDLSVISRHLEEPAQHDQILGQMEELKRELDGGADFAEVARRSSDSRDDGHLGFCTRDALGEQFAAIVFDLPVGQLSHVFASEYGLHLAKVHAYRAPGLLPFAEACEGIRRALLDEQRMVRLSAFVQELRGKATIEYL